MILFSKSIYKSKAVLISEIARSIIDWTQGICFAITAFKTIVYFRSTYILRRFLWLSLVWVRLKLSRYILRHSTEQMIFDILRVNPRSCFDKSNIASLGIAIKRRFGKVFVMFDYIKQRAVTLAGQSRSFYQNTEIKQSKSPSSSTFFCCRRGYNIAIDLATFDETGPCWQQSYRLLWKEMCRHGTFIITRADCRKHCTKQLGLWHPGSSYLNCLFIFHIDCTQNPKKSE